MANKEIWRQRVKAWRASGQGADEFCGGEEYSAALLRHWAWRLGLTRRRKRRPDAAPVEPVRLARVVRVSSRPTGQGGVMFIEVGRARVEVGAGVDEETLATVMRVLDGRVRAAEEQA